MLELPARDPEEMCPLEQPLEGSFQLIRLERPQETSIREALREITIDKGSYSACTWAQCFPATAAKRREISRCIPLNGGSARSLELGFFYS